MERLESWPLIGKLQITITTGLGWAFNCIEHASLEGEVELWEWKDGGNNDVLRNLWKRETSGEDAAEMTWLCRVFRTTPWLGTLSHLLRTPPTNGLPCLDLMMVFPRDRWYLLLNDGQGSKQPRNPSAQVKAELIPFSSWSSPVAAMISFPKAGCRSCTSFPRGGRARPVGGRSWHHLVRACIPLRVRKLTTKNWFRVQSGFQETGAPSTWGPRRWGSLNPNPCESSCLLAREKRIFLQAGECGQSTQIITPGECRSDLFQTGISLFITQRQ